MKVSILNRSEPKTHIWIKEAAAELDWVSPQRAYLALRAVLHALRDRLIVEEIAQFGAQLPVFIRGVYYEGWNPAVTPVKNRKKEAFLAQIAHDFSHTRNPVVDAEQVARAIFRVLTRQVSPGELTHIVHLLPADIRELWPRSKAA